LVESPKESIKLIVVGRKSGITISRYRWERNCANVSWGILTIKGDLPKNSILSPIVVRRKLQPVLGSWKVEGDVIGELATVGNDGNCFIDS